MADFPVTLTSGNKSVLTDVERAVHGFSVKYTIPYTVVTGSGLTTTADTCTVILGNTPTNWFVSKSLVNVRTAYVGTTALAMGVGTTSSVAAFIASTAVTGSPKVIGMAVGVPVLTNANATASVSMVAVFTPTVGGNPAVMTAGALDIYLNVVNVALDLP